MLVARRAGTGKGSSSCSGPSSSSILAVGDTLLCPTLYHHLYLFLSFFPSVLDWADNIATTTWIQCSSSSSYYHAIFI